MIVAVQPSYWQQLLFGLVVIVPTLAVAAILLDWLARSVLGPRAAGRRWPEGARGVRPVVELVVDAQRVPAPVPSEFDSAPGADVSNAAATSEHRPAAAPAPAGRHVADRRVIDRAVWVQAARFGLVVATCAVIPVSTGLVVTQPGLGLYTLAVLLGLDALAVWAAGDRRAEHADAGITRAGLAVVLGLMAGVVHAQWGTASLSGVVAAQANGAVGGIDVWGLPTFAVHPLACAVAVAAGWATLVTMDAAPDLRLGAVPGWLTRLVNQAWSVAVAAWLVAAFAGGGAVPWTIDDAGTRQVTSVAVFATKTTLVTLALAWARATWSTVSVRTVRLLLALGALVGVGVIGVTLSLRHLV